MQERDDGNSATLRGSKFRPNEPSLQRPWREQNNEFISCFQEVANVLFEVGARFDVRLVQERL